MQRVIVMAALCLLLAAMSAQAADCTRDGLDELLDATVHDWRFKLGECPGAEAVEFDDAAWEQVDVGHRWWPHDSTCWYRKRITIPETVSGLPVAGATIRLRVGMDNEAKAYVNGEFKQQFTWADGDILLAENAQPGDIVTVALCGINRPGYGSLYEAYLVSSAGKDMVEGLRAFLAAYDMVQSYVPYAPRREAPHWVGLMYTSLQRLDLDAYRAMDSPAFLASLEEAYNALFSDTEKFERHLERAADKLEELKALIEEGEAAGRQMAYPRVDARVVESFLEYARDDLTDGNMGHTLRALRTARFLYAACAEGFLDAQAILGNPALDIEVPQYKTGPVAIHDGAFWQDDRPLFFTGVGHFGQVRKDVPILTQYGLNIIQIEMGPNSVVTGPDTIDDTPIRQGLLPVLDSAAAHNVMVNLLISPHYFPQWAIQRNPKLAECGHGFMRHCIDAPEARQIYEQYLRALMPLIAGHPALHSICLSNEPQYDGRCEYTRTNYHRWLQEEHGTIDALNAIYNTGFASFDEVPLPEDASNYAHFYDYCRFNQDRFLGFHEFLRDLVHEAAPDLPVHAKVMSHAFGDPGKFEVGVNYEDFTLLGAIAGNDCVQTFEGDLPTEYLQRWQDMALNYTFQRSVAPDKPVFNSEDHIIGDGDVRFIPASHIRTAYWTQAIHGQGAATTWVWERAQEGDFAENILTRANCVRALGHVALDLNRLAREVLALQRAKSDLAILYAFASMLPSNDFTNEAAAAFEGAYFADTHAEFITERQAVAGDLKKYKLVIAPNASHVADTVVEALQAYVASGGVVMTAGECFTHDEHGRLRDAGLEQAGKGRLAVYGHRMTPRAYREILNVLLDEAGCRRPVRLKGQYGEPVWGVNLRTVEHEGRQLVNLVNYGRLDQAVVLEMGAPVPRAVNLFDNTEVKFPLTLPPLDPVLLAIEAQ